MSTSATPALPPLLNTKMDSDTYCDTENMDIVNDYNYLEPPA